MNHYPWGLDAAPQQSWHEVQDQTRRGPDYTPMPTPFYRSDPSLQLGSFIPRATPFSYASPTAAPQQQLHHAHHAHHQPMPRMDSQGITPSYQMNVSSPQSMLAGYGYTEPIYQTGARYSHPISNGFHYANPSYRVDANRSQTTSTQYGYTAPSHRMDSRNSQITLTQHGHTYPTDRTDGNRSQTASSQQGYTPHNYQTGNTSTQQGYNLRSSSFGNSANKLTAPASTTRGNRVAANTDDSELLIIDDVKNIPSNPAERAVRQGSPKVTKIKTTPSAASGGVPEPSAEYLVNICLGPPRMLPRAKPLLVIFDLNGTLVYRPRRGASYHARPHSDTFINYCMDRFSMMVWSSATRPNVEAMCDRLMKDHPEVPRWSRDRLGLSKSDMARDVQVYKRLQIVWSDASIQASHPFCRNGEKWDRTNTVLVDDSSEKARSEPFNCITLPAYEGIYEEVPVLPRVHAYLNVLACQEDVSRYIKAHPFDIGAAPPKIPSTAMLSDEGYARLSMEDRIKAVAEVYPRLPHVSAFQAFATRSARSPALMNP